MIWKLLWVSVVFDLGFVAGAVFRACAETKDATR